MSFVPRPVVYEPNDGILHSEHESRDTRVSEYLRKYGQGKIDVMPTDSRPQVVDDRSDDEKISDPFVPSLGTDELDVFQQLEANREKFQAAQADIEMTKKDRVRFDNAIKIINDDNASIDAQRDAYRILEELERKGKVSRVRD